MDAVQASADAAVRILARDEPVYGINTGFGKLASTRIDDHDLAKLQRNIILSHAAGVGEVVFQYITEDQAAVNAAAAGEVDVLTGFDPNLTEQIEQNGDWTVVLGTATDKSVLAMNSTAAPLDDQRVRQAIRQAIDAWPAATRASIRNATPAWSRRR